MKEKQQVFDGLEEEIQQEEAMASVMEALETFETRKAEDLLVEYEQAYGQDEFWHIITIDLAEQNSDPETMLDAIHDAEKFGIDPNELALRYGRFCYMVGRPEDALEYLSSCQFEEDSDQEFYKTHLEAYCYLIASDYKAAVNKLEDLLLDTDDYRLLILAALCYKELGRQDRADEYLTRGLASRKDFAPEYTEVMAAYHYDPETIFANRKTIFQQLAGTRSQESVVSRMSEAIEAMNMLGESAFQEEDFRLLYGEYLKEPAENPMEAAIQAAYYEAVQNTGKSQELWKQVLNMDWDADPVHNALYMYFRLMAMEALNLSPKSRIKYIRRFWEAQHVPILRAQLMIYAAEHKMDSLLWEMVVDETLTFASDLERCEYNMARAKVLLQIEQYQAASELIEEMWDVMEDNEEYLVLASGSAVITDNKKLLEKVSQKLMPHGIIAFHLLEYFDMTGNPNACRKVQRLMKAAMDDPNVEVPEEEFYRSFLKTFQKRHRRY